MHKCDGIVVHTLTKDEFIKVVRYCLDYLDLKWVDNSDNINIRRWELDGKYTCIRISNHINYSYIKFYERCLNMKILSTAEFFDTVAYSRILKDFK